eukprot:7398153-Alexandrium_andersonii.AAC.1
MEWAPFDSPSLAPALSNTLESVHGVADTALHVVHWRDALKLHQWERTEARSSIGREHVYQIAKQFHAGRTRRSPNTFNKSRK